MYLFLGLDRRFFIFDFNVQFKGVLVDGMLPISRALTAALKFKGRQGSIIPTLFSCKLQLWFLNK